MRNKKFYFQIFFILSFALLLTGSVFAEAKESPNFGWPIDNVESYNITAAYDLDRAEGTNADWTGWKTGDATAGSGHSYDNHSGTDWGMVTDTNLYAVANGTVNSLYESYPADDHSGGGNYIIFNMNGTNQIQGESYLVNFWHLNYLGALKSVGDSVVKGELVAKSDNTGNSTGPHLHFGIEKTTGSYSYTCPFYHGWFEDDEFFRADTRLCLKYVTINSNPLNCRMGTSTSYSIITSIPAVTMAACQKNGWYKIFIPMPPAKSHESTDAAGALASGYTESGTWTNSSDKSTVTDAADDANRTPLSGLGSRYSVFSGTGGTDYATYTWTAPQRGNYALYTTWSGNANARNVNYRVTDSNGTTDKYIDQKGTAASSGTGTHADPYIITSSPYTASHTTIGGDDTWNTYTPVGSGISEYGPERIYKFDLLTTNSVTITVDHTGYPTYDVDVHLLSALSNTSCIARADWTVTETDLPPGTYYISIDSFGTGNTAATAYNISVTFGETEPFANKWIKVGEYFFANAAAGTLQIREDSVTGKLNASAEGRVYADAIKIVPLTSFRSGWVSDSYVTVVDTAVNPVACVVVTADSTGYSDSNDWTEEKEFPVYANSASGTSNTSDIVAKAVTGQRFICTEISADKNWYKINLTNGCGATTGWILGDNLIIYNKNAISEVENFLEYK